MTYHTWTNVWGGTVICGILIWLVLFAFLVTSLYSKNHKRTRLIINYIINSLTFLFVAWAFISFALVVNGPRGQARKTWVLEYSLEMFLRAVVVTVVLSILNYFYQKHVQRSTSFKNIIILATIDLLVMCWGIFLGGQLSLAEQGANA